MSKLITSPSRVLQFLVVILTCAEQWLKKFGGSIFKELCCKVIALLKTVSLMRLKS